MKMLKSAFFALGLGLFSVAAHASIENPVKNVEYRVIEQQAVTPGAKIEVTEFFWYSCPHCFAFDPYLAAWVKTQGDKIIFKRVPVAFRPGDEMQQKLYYALEMMGKSEEMHNKIFRAIHIDHQQFKEEADIADFVAKQGIDRAKFLEAFRSFAAQTKAAQATRLAATYAIDQVPILAIGGKYETAPSIAGSSLRTDDDHQYFAAAFKVTEWLMAKSAAEKK